MALSDAICKTELNNNLAFWLALVKVQRLLSKHELQFEDTYS